MKCDLCNNDAQYHQCQQCINDKLVGSHTDEQYDALLQARNDSLFVLRNKSYLNTEAVRDTLDDILTEAIRKASQ